MRAERDQILHRSLGPLLDFHFGRILENPPLGCLYTAINFFYKRRHAVPDGERALLQGIRDVHYSQVGRRYIDIKRHRRQSEPCLRRTLGVKRADNLAIPLFTCDLRVHNRF